MGPGEVLFGRKAAHGSRLSSAGAPSRRIVAGDDGFQLLTMRGNPVLALPRRCWRARLNAISTIHGFTAKRWIFKQILRVAVITGVDRIVTTPCDDPLERYAGINTGSFLSTLNAALSKPAATLALVWPWPPAIYRGRLYVHLFDASGVPNGFAKLALERSEDKKMAAEAGMLRALDTIAGAGIRTPALLDSGEIQGKAFVLAEPLPAGVKPAGTRFPNELFENLCGGRDRLSLERLKSMPWWPRLQRIVDGLGDFGRDMTAGVRRNGLAVCRVHGDFSSKNVFQRNREFWIVDWERAALAGPALVDRVCYEFANVPGVFDAKYALDILRGKFGNGRNSRLDLAAALGYLVTQGSTEADGVLKLWSSISKEVDRESFVS